MITYANDKSFTIEASSHADYISQLKSKFLQISFKSGRDYMKEGFHSQAID